MNFAEIEIKSAIIRIYFISKVMLLQRYCETKWFLVGFFFFLVFFCITPVMDKKLAFYIKLFTFHFPLFKLCLSQLGNVCVCVARSRKPQCKVIKCFCLFIYRYYLFSLFLVCLSVCPFISCSVLFVLFILLYRQQLRSIANVKERK